MPSAWLRRNVFQPCDGGPRLFTIYLATLVWPISMPSLSNSPWIRGAPRHATDLGTTRSLPVRHSDCLRSELSDRTLLFGQPGRPCRWHCGGSHRLGGTHSPPISKYPSIKRGAQFLSAVCDGVDTSMAPAI